MNKNFSESQMIDRIKKYCKSDIIHLQVQKTAYSNYVYLFITKDGQYMYKEYIKNIGVVDKTEELKIQLQIGFPKILFFDDNYRIEEYVQSQPVDFIFDLQKIAKTLQNFHKLSIECKCTHQTMLDNIIKKLFHQYTEESNTTNLQKEDIVETKNCLESKNEFFTMKNSLKKHDTELELLEKIKKCVLKIIKSKESHFCHNDLQIGNMIKVGDSIEFIDFEYASYGNKYTDIANFFCEAMSDYATDCILKEEIGLSKKQKLLFLAIYEPETNPEELLDVIEKMTCFSHFFWYMWARYMHTNSCGPSKSFNYCKYAMCRLSFLRKLNIIDDKEYQILEIK